MFRGVVLLALLATAHAQGEDLEAVMKRIFGSPNSTTNNLVAVARESSTLVPEIPTTTPAGANSCLTVSGEKGICVPFYLCKTNNTIVTDGMGIIDARFGIGNTVGEQQDKKPCEIFWYKCCTLSEHLTTGNAITPAPTTSKKVCGYRNLKGVTFRITGDGDSKTNFGEFPWMVAIIKITPVNENEPNGLKYNAYVGGGSLIHPSVVLTTAHYVAGVEALRARAGEWDTQNKNEPYPHQDRDVKEVVTHKDFYKGNFHYDIALLFLVSPMEMAPNVGVACLPPAGERAPAGANCYSSGWGKDLFEKKGRYQHILKRVELPVVDRNACQEALRWTRLGPFFMLHSSFMCAGGELGKDTCKGDGGSPLVCPIQFQNDRYQQNGIVSWGIGCGSDGTPGVYVDVGILRDWIDDQVVDRGYDPNTYTY